MYFKNKYIKYKNKYLALKKQIGGAAAGKDELHLHTRKRKIETRDVVIVPKVSKQNNQLLKVEMTPYNEPKIPRTIDENLNIIDKFLLLWTKRDCEINDAIMFMREIMRYDIYKINNKILVDFNNFVQLDKYFNIAKEKAIYDYLDKYFRRRESIQHKVANGLPLDLVETNIVYINSSVEQERNRYIENEKYGDKQIINKYYNGDNIINNAFGSSRIIIEDKPYFCMRVLPDCQYDSENHISIIIKIKFNEKPLGENEDDSYILNIKLFRYNLNSNYIKRQSRTIQSYHETHADPSQYIGFSNFNFDNFNYSKKIISNSEFSYIQSYGSNYYSYLFIKIQNPYNICSDNYFKYYDRNSNRVLNMFYSYAKKIDYNGVPSSSDSKLTEEHNDMSNKGEHLIISNKEMKMISISRINKNIEKDYIKYEKDYNGEIEPNVLRRILFYLSTGEKSFAVKVIGHSNNNGDEEFYNQHIKDKLNIDIHSIVNRYCDTFTDTPDESDVIYSPYVGKDINEQKLTNNQINASKVYVPPIPVNFACQL